MTVADRRAVAARAEHCCEYCFSQEMLSHDDFAVEHIYPRASSGSDDLSNLAFSCQGCNNRKYTAVQAEDPATGVLVPLYHPRQDRWQAHFVWSVDYSYIEGITPFVP
jgi:5-methylcytosine-specific restriction endonuclease McrA